MRLALTADRGPWPLASHHRFRFHACRGAADDPLIVTIIDKLPSSGPWPTAERVTWMKMLAMAYPATRAVETKRPPT